MDGQQETGQRILVVDDDPDVRDALCQVLLDEGYAVDGAGNGVEALGRLRGGCRPDLILLDLMMPVMNGWQFLAERDQDSGLAKVPVLVLSASRDRQPVPAIGVAGSVEKPIDLDELLRTVARHCRTPG